MRNQADYAQLAVSGAACAETGPSALVLASRWLRATALWQEFREGGRQVMAASCLPAKGQHAARSESFFDGTLEARS
jgi:hypothetical protein